MCVCARDLQVCVCSDFDYIRMDIADVNTLTGRIVHPRRSHVILVQRCMNENLFSDQRRIGMVHYVTRLRSHQTRCLTR